MEPTLTPIPAFSEYSDEDEVFDVLVSAATSLALCLERRLPKGLQAEVATTLDSVWRTIERLSEDQEWLH